MNVEKLKALGAAVRTGGKGTMRRKKKTVHKAAGTDDKRLQSTLKRLGVNTIPGIEEVDIVQGEEVLHFVNPKVQASIAANTYVVSGPSQTKSASDMMPPNIQQMLAQMGPDGLQKLMAQMGMPGGEGPAPGAGAGGEEDDDDVPDLVENFEEAAEAK
ncbi:transcription factor [Raphidocelis subcapitata]|uniref:Nascent polypeptide-associated complex subunit beta n=1 Tax=Raphidocelis subcapitata TaxID=307507 RepID=A0A2V0PD53_9CHLO|nr:transcription factor [Raphidocelis subcapitata]|eukprot:GBF95820.1 transcription factor [Raphidocelis subcapitata]